MKHAYLIGSVPWYAWPFYAVHVAFVATGIALYLLVLRLTCRIELQGVDPRALGRNHVLAVWHDLLLPFFACLAPFRNHVWTANMHAVRVSALEWMSPDGQDPQAGLTQPRGRTPA